MSGPDTDTFTTLNPGTAGDSMDGTAVAFAFAIPPLTRKRERVVIGGDQPAELADVLNANPATSLYGLLTRPIAQAAHPGIPGKVVAGAAFNWAASATGNNTSATQPAPGANRHNVVTSLSVSIAHATVALSTAATIFRVRATPSGTILWTAVLGVSTTIGSATGFSATPALLGPINEDLIIESIGGGTAGVTEAVAFNGYIVDVS